MNKFLWLCREAGVATDTGGASATITQPLDTGALPAAAASAPAATAPSFDVLHDAAIAATEAWQADSKPELKQKAVEAVAAAKAFKQPTATVSQFTVPDLYKDKPYLKGVDSPEKLFKMLDGAQELIGKKGPARPIDGAPQAEWDAYYEANGRPKTAAEYIFEPVEGLKYDEKLTQGVKDLMFKNGINAAQAKELQKGFDGLVAQIAKEKGLELKQMDTDFDKLGSESFGAQRDQILANSKALLDKFTSPNMKAYVSKLPNESLVVMADVLNNINKIYIKEDTVPAGGPTANGMTPAQMSAKGRELMASEAYNNPWHKDHARVAQEVKDLYNPAKR